MKHYFLLTLCVPTFIFAQVKIEYGVNISNNLPEELNNSKLHGNIFLHHEKSELLKSKSDLVRLESFYLSSLNYTLNNSKKLLQEEELFFAGEYDFVNPIKGYEFVKRGDTLFERSYPILVSDKIYVQNTVPSINEYGDQNIDADGNFLYYSEPSLLNIYDRLAQISFNETWNIDNKGKFSKTLHYYSLAHPLEREGMILGFAKLPNVLNNSPQKFNPNTLFKSVQYDVFFQYIESESEAIDLIMFPTYYHHLYPLEKLHFLKPLFEGVKSGAIDIYSNNKFDEKGHPIKITDNKLEYISFKEDIPVIDEETGDFAIDNDGNLISRELIIPYTTNDVVGFRFLEEWYLDEKTNTFSKVVKYYAPIFRIMRDGILVGKTPLFWIKN
jgi:hypothetical protein